MKNLYVIHTSPKRIDFVQGYMIPCFERYGIKDIIVWNDVKMEGQLQAWTKCAEWIVMNKPDYEGTWHLEDDVVPCKNFKAIADSVSAEGIIVQGFVTNNPFADFKGKTGKLPVQCLPYGMQCIYIPNFYLKGFIYFVDKYVNTGLYHKRQYDCGTLYSDNVFRGLVRKYCKDSCVNILEDCMVEHIDYLIGGRSIKKQKFTDRRAIKFDNYEEVELLKRWVEQEGKYGQTEKGNR